MFLLPLGAWDGLRYFIVALPEPTYNYFWCEGRIRVLIAPVPGHITFTESYKLIQETGA